MTYDQEHYYEPRKLRAVLRIHADAVRSAINISPDELTSWSGLMLSSGVFINWGRALRS